MREFEQILSGLVRVGTVTDRQMDKRLARVWFPDLGISSDWLPVLISQDVTPDDIPREYDDPQWTEFETEDKIPQAGETRYVPHKHKIRRKPWMPKVGDEVLTVYLPVLDADGFIVGGIKRWR